jgi:hypothetical protein
MPYFNQVKRFSLFAASSRSGHSIMAHLLSAHPKVLISDDLAAVKFFREGYSRDQVFALIRYQDLCHQKRNRQKGDYNYKVDGVWQNINDKHSDVIGDASGVRALKLLGEDNHDFINVIRDRLQMPLRVFIHLCNPFDTIATKVNRRGMTLKSAAKHFIRFDQMLSTINGRLSEEEKLIQRHEDVVKDPQYHFTKMYEFLGVEPISQVVNACAQKILAQPAQTINRVDWSRDMVKVLGKFIRKSPFFKSYMDDL